MMGSVVLDSERISGGGFRNKWESNVEARWVFTEGSSTMDSWVVGYVLDNGNQISNSFVKINPYSWIKSVRIVSLLDTSWRFFKDCQFI